MSELLMQFGASAAEGGWVLNRNEPIFLIEQLQLLQLMSKEKIPEMEVAQRYHKHLKVQLDPPDSNVTFLDERRSVGSPC